MDNQSTPTGIPEMGLQMPEGQTPSNTESRLADLEARVQALEDASGAGGATGSPVPPTGQ